MGRYYSGDINGKFMFSIQPSDAGNRFGAKEMHSNYIDYSVDRNQYENIVKELDIILKTGSVDKVKKMFEKNNLYNEKTMKKFNVTNGDLRQYADYKLGTQMIEWFDENEDEDELNYFAEL